MRERWPAARVAVVVPFPRALGTPVQRELERRVRRDLAIVAVEAGVEVIDLARVLPAAAPGLRCANGYNLNERGSALAGERLATWIAAGVSSPVAA